MLRLRRRSSHRWLADPKTWLKAKHSDPPGSSSLEPVREAHPNDEIGVRYDDMIWRLRWRDSGDWIYIYLMLEFQSTVQQFMAVRVLDYDGGLYRQIVRALRPKHDDKLPIVLPLVLYRGDRKWTAKEDVFDLIAPAPAEIAPYLPHLRGCYSTSTPSRRTSSRGCAQSGCVPFLAGGQRDHEHAADR